MTSTSDKPAFSRHISPTSPHIPKIARLVAALSLIGLLVLVRVIYPGSDAYARLTWSSALLTDEGFYIHNARNVVLFGHARTDEFNNALIMPLLHGLQVLVFRTWGVGAMQARSISIALSLLTLLAFGDALRRVWGARCAWGGVALLGLDPTFALYNRLALMDTPACLPLCLAFWMWTIAQQKGEQEKGERRKEKGSLFPLLLCGACLGLAYCARGLCAIVVPVPVLLLAAPLWRQVRAERRAAQGQAPHETPASLLPGAVPLAAMLSGLTLVLLAYMILWYLPNRTEMAHVNRFYLHEQLLPRSAAQLGRNLWSAFLDRHRGVFPFLLKHSFVMSLFGGYCVCRLLKRRRGSAVWRDIQGADHDLSAGIYSGRQGSTGAGWTLFGDEPAQNQAQKQSAYYLAGWLLVFLVFVSVVDYAPSRYYVMYYPALAGLAAVALDGLLGTAALTGTRVGRRVALLFGLLWVASNGYWYADWVGHLTYRQQSADAWLASHLPANSVLLGAIAPGLCLNNHFQCVVMIENLCNDHAPVEHFAGQPRYIVILDTDADAERNLRLPSQRLWANRWKEKWWSRHYASLVRHDKRLYAFPHMLRRYFTVGVYPVPATYHPTKMRFPRTKVRIRPYWRDSVSSEVNVHGDVSGDLSAHFPLDD